MLGYLNPREEEAVKKLKNLLTQKLGNKLWYIYLYGSKARGDYQENSDIDLLIVADDLNLEVKDIIGDALVDIQIEYEAPISIHTRSLEYFNKQMENRLNLFMNNIKKEGIAV